MFVVVTYDISHNKRRMKLFKALKNFGTPVQFSAFECILNDKGLIEVQKVIKCNIKAEEDKVRIYVLCERCQGEIKNVGKGEITKKHHVIVI